MLTREALYDLVWSEPMLKVAARFNVSSSYMARVCASLNVPRPERGYWAKMAVGKAPPKPGLPDPRPGDGLAWSQDHTNVPIARPLAMPKATAATTSPQVDRTRRPARHPLVAGVKTLFEGGRLSYDTGYLKPAKRLLLDLAVTKTGLDKALSFASELFLTLEDQGHRVLIAPNGEPFQRAEVDEHETPRKNRGYSNLWSPGRCTVVYVGTVAIGLTIIEMSEEAEARYVNGQYVRLSDYIPPKRGRHSVDLGWTTKRDYPTGRLCLQAYSPYYSTNWIRHWREAKQEDLTTRIPSIVRELERAATEIASLVAQAEQEAESERKRWEAQQAQWRSEEAKKRAAEALKSSKAELFQIIADWSESKRLAEFFAEVEQRLHVLPEHERNLLLDRLQRGRELVQGTDALERLRSWKAPSER